MQPTRINRINQTSSAGLLKQALHRVQDTRPTFSSNALARKMGLSSSFLSNVLNGKKPIPENRIDEFIQCLDMDIVCAQALKEAMFREKMEQLKVAASDLDLQQLGSNTETVEKYEIRKHKDFDILDRWYYLATLALASTDEFIFEAEWVAWRLMLDLDQAKDALEFLLINGFLMKIDGKWKAQEERVRFVTNSPQEKMSEHQAQLLDRVKNEMKTQKGEKRYGKRMVSGMLLTANPQNVQKAKAIMQDAIYRASEVLMDKSNGPCNEIFQVGGIVAPVSCEDAGE